ncbi:DinB family protein [Flavobacterium sp. Sd200]|uniref:DinB family protein n=1 Tax=Flavobacterium sp. Sd200 TaxID=2692211 RepID=UPI0013716843|nr:DinB family protein [Flavobacterium sp. Sd200]MXN91040.1 DinB family protein [Flavobacterium sp. Sd200]
MPQQIVNQLETALGETITLLSGFDEKDLNTVPFEGSWTAAQVGRHLFKSQDGIDTLLAAATPAADRAPDARAEEFKKIFLDFSTKMKSPDFILPENKEFDKERLIQSLTDTKEKMVEAVQENDLTGIALLPDAHPLKGSTKLEIVYFVTYHTMRHNHQIKKIREVV